MSPSTGSTGQGGVGGAVGKYFGGKVIAGAVNSALSQGVGYAMGWQKDFSWGAVASAGLSAGLGFRNGYAQFSARVLVDAAARSLIDGGDFGDNVIAALPRVIGQTIGEAIAGTISGEMSVQEQVRALRGELRGTDATDAEIDQAASVYAELLRSGDQALLNMGEPDARGATYRGRTYDQRAAYAIAIDHGKSAAVASNAARVVALREALESWASALAETDAGPPEAFQRFEEDLYAALFSAEVYYNRGNPTMIPTGATRERVYNYEGENGYFGVLYRTADGRRFYANRGVTEEADGRQSVIQAMGLDSSQYRRAGDIARQLVREFPSTRITFVGHSLGGGLAQLQSAITGQPAIIFNPAGVHPRTLARFDANFDRARHLITSYEVNGEVLTWTTDHKGQLAAAAAARGDMELAVLIAQIPDPQGVRIKVPAIEPLTSDVGSLRPTAPLAIPLRSLELHAMGAVATSMFFQYSRSGRWP